MDRVSTLGLIDPNDNQPSTCRRSPDRLLGAALLQVGFGAVEGNVSFWMVLTEVVSARGVPDDLPIVHPFSIYDWDGRKGRYLDDFRTAILSSAPAAPDVLEPVQATSCLMFELSVLRSRINIDGGPAHPCADRMG